jgi:hypothetical protein
MGAPNFGRGNASKIYTMFFPTEEKYKECDECGEKHREWECTLETLTECENGCENPTFTEKEECVHPESSEINEEIEHIKEKLEELPFLSRGSDRRNDGESFLVGLRQYKDYGDLEAYVEVYCFLEHGYHEGARLDWYVNLGFNNSDFDDDIDSDAILAEYGYSSDLPRGLQVILSKKALVWLKKTKDEMIEKVEGVYDEVSGLKLQCDAIFSNGEAIYSEID